MNTSKAQINIPETHHISIIVLSASENMQDMGNRKNNSVEEMDDQIRRGYTEREKLGGHPNVI